MSTIQTGETHIAQTVCSWQATKLNFRSTSHTHTHTQISTGSVNTPSTLFAHQQANGPNSGRTVCVCVCVWDVRGGGRAHRGTSISKQGQNTHCKFCICDLEKSAAPLTTHTHYLSEFTNRQRACVGHNDLKHVRLQDELVRLFVTILFAGQNTNGAGINQKYSQFVPIMEDSQWKYLPLKLYKKKCWFNLKKKKNVKIKF